MILEFNGTGIVGVLGLPNGILRSIYVIKDKQRLHNNGILIDIQIKRLLGADNCLRMILLK